jgi:hypothetical protein
MSWKHVSSLSPVALLLCRIHHQHLAVLVEAPSDSDENTGTRIAMAVATVICILVFPVKLDLRNYSMGDLVGMIAASTGMQWVLLNWLYDNYM